MWTFNQITKIRNLVPNNGTVNYHGKIFNKEKSDFYFNKLFNTIKWQHDKAIILGNLIHTKRKVAWYGDENYSYTYSKTTKQALNWTKELLELKTKIEKISNTKFNSCLLNLYHNGEEGMAWHSDSEEVLGKDTTIASLSFGAQRKFSFKNKKTKDIINIDLENGSLLIMKEETQTNWLHRHPPTKKVLTPRINLTFRTIIKSNEIQ